MPRPPSRARSPRHGRQTITRKAPTTDPFAGRVVDPPPARPTISKSHHCRTSIRRPIPIRVHCEWHGWPWRWATSAARRVRRAGQGDAAQLSAGGRQSGEGRDCHPQVPGAFEPRQEHRSLRPKLRPQHGGTSRRSGAVGRVGRGRTARRTGGRHAACLWAVRAESAGRAATNRRGAAAGRRRRLACSGRRPPRPDCIRARRRRGRAASAGLRQRIERAGA